MAIRVEKDPMGMGGRAWYVASAAEIGELPRSAAELVSPRVAEMFRDVPRSFEAMATRAPLPGMRRWLGSIAEVRCELEVYTTRDYGSETRLRFHVTEDWAPSIRGIPAVPARACPEILQRVHALTGDIDCHYGCSGTLVALDKLRTLKELVSAREIVAFDSVEKSLAGRPELWASLGVYEVDGDWLCAAPGGRAVWSGGEWAEDVVAVTPLDLATALDRYFDALASQREFHPDAAPSL